MRSWATVQPMAMRPWSVDCSDSSPAILTRTTLDEMEATPPMKAAVTGSAPRSSAVPRPRPRVMATCTGVPKSASRPTEASSPSRNRRPMLNMRRETPMSARARISPRSATKPGVKGPTRSPAAT